MAKHLVFSWLEKWHLVQLFIQFPTNCHLLQLFSDTGVLKTSNNNPLYSSNCGTANAKCEHYEPGPSFALNSNTVWLWNMCSKQQEQAMHNALSSHDFTTHITHWKKADSWMSLKYIKVIKEIEHSFQKPSYLFSQLFNNVTTRITQAILCSKHLQNSK